MRRWPLLSLGIALAVAVIVAVILLASSGDETVDVVTRRAAQTVSPRPDRVRLREREELSPLDRRTRSGEVAPEQNRRTPLSAADPIASSDFAATELQDASDPRGSGDAFALFASRTVDQQGNALFIAEPSIAAKGERRLVVWNRGAAFSNDGGRTFTYVDPRTQFPDAVGGFCCDQVAVYVPGQDLWLWYLQYDSDASGANIGRLAIARGDAAFDARRFQYYDLSARDFPQLELPAGAWLDYPNLSATRKHLFLATNVYSRDSYGTTLVLRTPLDALATGAPPRWRYIVSRLGTADFSDGATDAMYFAQHLDTGTLRVWRWEDAAEGPVHADVEHSAYPRTFDGFECERLESLAGDWCGREDQGVVTNDDRPTGGWVAGDTVGFAWNSPRDSEQGFPYPFVMTVLVNRHTLALEDERPVWHPRYAYQYASFSPNARGDVGGIALAGGGERYQTCAALISDQTTKGSWEARAADVSDSDPARDAAGDYFGIAPRSPGSNVWAASCASLRGGGAATNVAIRMYEFGRVKDGAE